MCACLLLRRTVPQFLVSFTLYIFAYYDHHERDHVDINELEYSVPETELPEVDLILVLTLTEFDVLL